MHTLKFCQLGNISESDYLKQILYEENHPIKTLWNLDRLFLAKQNRTMAENDHFAKLNQAFFDD